MRASTVGAARYTARATRDAGRARRPGKSTLVRVACTGEGAGRRGEGEGEGTGVRSPWSPRAGSGPSRGSTEPPLRHRVRCRRVVRVPWLPRRQVCVTARAESSARAARVGQGTVLSGQRRKSALVVSVGVRCPGGCAQ